MFHKTVFYGVLIGLLMACSALPAAAQDDPTEIASSFYTWYLDYAGYDEASQEFRNPLVDSSYQERTELSARLIEQVAALREEQGGYHYDPFLCAQDLPERFEAELITLQGQHASVLVHEYFAWNPHPKTLEVTLIAQDGAWQIDSVNCQESITPSGVTESFYGWYLSQLPEGDGLQGDNPFLTEDLNVHFAEPRQRGPGSGDPVLCAQDFPVSVAVDEVMVGEQKATMIVREFFSGNPQPITLTVRLIHDTQWLIEDIICEVAPETVAELLYNEYLTFTRYDIAHGIDRTPIADWSPYPWAHYVGEDLLDSLLGQYRSGEARPADPFLCAQDIPSWVDVEQVEASSTDQATLRIKGAYPSGPETFASYDLALAEMALSPAGGWQMVRLTCGR